MQLKGYINNHPLVALVGAVIQQNCFKRPGSLIVQQRFPPVRRDKFRQNDRGLLPVVMCQVDLREKIEQGLNK